MNDEHLMLLGSIKTHLEHIQKTTDETKLEIKNFKKEAGEKIEALEKWRNGLVIAGSTAVGIFSLFGIAIQKAIASIIHH